MQKHIKDAVHQCAEDCNIDSEKVENFVAVACSHVYFDTLKVCEKSVRAAVVELMLELERERTKISLDPQENDDTSIRE